MEKEGKEIAIDWGGAKERSDRAPTAGLYENQTEEGEIGLPSKTMDVYFSGIDISIEYTSKIDFKVNNSKH